MLIAQAQITELSEAGAKCRLPRSSLSQGAGAERRSLGEAV